MIYRLALALLCVITTGCVSVTYNIKKDTTSTISPLASSKDKRIRLDVRLITDERDVLEKGHAGNKKNIFFDSVLYELRRIKSLKSVHEKPSKVSEVILSRFYQDDYLLEVFLDEKILKEDHARFLRVITFGAVPERLEKILKYEVKLQNLKNGDTRSFTREILVDMTINSFVLFFPYDFNMHPFSFEKQVEYYKALIFPDILKLLNGEVVNAPN